jgi:hypothetical protein
MKLAKGLFVCAVLGACDGAMIGTDGGTSRPDAFVELPDGRLIRVDAGPPTPGEVTVTVAPRMISIATGATTRFTVTVTGTSNTSVSWTVTDGDIDAEGNFTAPDAEGQYRVVATSNADPSRSGEATVRVMRPTPTDLVAGTWNDITPPGLILGDSESTLGAGIAVDPNDPLTLYWCNPNLYEGGPHAGLYKSTDGGREWRRLCEGGEPEGGQTRCLQQPMHVRVDPDDGQHLYANDGVRGGTLGFWESHDGGESWTQPDGFREIGDTREIFVLDLYDIAVDPMDFDHILVSSHSGWDEGSSGVLESVDGGESWIVHDYEPSWGTGHSINFLYDPSHALGDRDTWLLGTQGDGYWRTTDGGERWTRVSPVEIVHGGGDIYYASDGVLYASGAQNLRSEDNGESWDEVGESGSAIFGDGHRLYSGRLLLESPEPLSTSLESDGRSWGPAPDDEGGRVGFHSGPFEMAFDPVNRIVYASNWTDGLWAMPLIDAP